MSQEYELSAKEYAALYKLTTSHLEKDPLQSLGNPLLQVTDEDHSLPELIDHRDTLLAEGPHADNETLSFQASCTSPPYIGDRGLQEALSLPTHTMRDLKLELPLLRTDPEWDLRRFKRRIVPDLENEHLPLESINEQADQGMEWPSTYYDHLQEIWQQIRTERLPVTFEVLAYIKDCSTSPSDTRTFEDLETMGAIPTHKSVNIITISNRVYETQLPSREEFPDR